MRLHPGEERCQIRIGNVVRPPRDQVLELQRAAKSEHTQHIEREHLELLALEHLEDVRDSDLAIEV